MKKIILASLVTILVATACSRKTIPEKPRTDATVNEETAAESSAINSGTVVSTPAAPVKTVKITTPKYINVNDAVARKAVDGRLYYDLEGKRYWKNYKDGKYYIFNKNMTGNPDYKPTQ